MRNRKKIKFLCFISICYLFLLFAGCKTYEICECVRTVSPELDLNWGEKDTVTKTINEYFLESNGKLTKVKIQNYHTKNSEKNKTSEVVGYMNCENYCKIVKFIRAAMLKTQVINEPGNIVNFINYFDARNQVYWNVQWCPAFGTPNSKMLRQIDDSIYVYVSLIK